MYFAFSLVLTFDFFFLSYIFMPTTFSITYVRTVRTGSCAPGKDYVNEFLQKKNICNLRSGHFAYSTKRFTIRAENYVFF